MAHPVTRLVVCTAPGCPTLTDSGRCDVHPRDQRSRNHHGVPRQARGLGAGWDRVKRAVIDRDGGVCQLRLAGCTAIATTANHIVPRSKGGPTTAENLEASCAHCNASLGDRPHPRALARVG